MISRFFRSIGERDEGRRVDKTQNMELKEEMKRIYCGKRREIGVKNWGGTYVLIKNTTFFSEKIDFLPKKERKKHLHFATDGFILEIKVGRSGVKSRK